MALLASNGSRCVINNRPDNEGEGQPSSGAMRAAAEASGLGITISGGIRTDHRS